MAVRKLPDDATLIRLYTSKKEGGAGLTMTEIAREYGTTKQAVQWRLDQVTDTKVPRKAWPWEVEPRHRAGLVYQAVGDYLNLTERIRPLNAREQARLTKLMSVLEGMAGGKLETLVIDYDPDLPAGLYVRRRREGDPEKGLLAAGK